jgi:hypothetical protein
MVLGRGAGMVTEHRAIRCRRVNGLRRPGYRRRNPTLLRHGARTGFGLLRSAPSTFITCRARIERRTLEEPAEISVPQFMC